jgi:hypothetical protein
MPTEDDLEHNRRGLLSPTQRDRLLAEARTSRRVVIGVLIGPLVLFSAIFLIPRVRANPGMAALFLGGVELMMTLPAIAFFLKVRRFVADASEGRTAAHDGPLRVERVVNLDDERRFTGYTYQAYAGKVRLTVEPASLGEQLLPLAGTSGRLHYAPRSRFVLSFEPRP